MLMHMDQVWWSQFCLSEPQTTIIVTIITSQHPWHSAGWWDKPSALIWSSLGKLIKMITATLLHILTYSPVHLFTWSPVDTGSLKPVGSMGRSLPLLFINEAYIVWTLWCVLLEWAKHAGRAAALILICRKFQTKKKVFSSISCGQPIGWEQNRSCDGIFQKSLECFRACVNQSDACWLEGVV